MRIAALLVFVPALAHAEDSKFLRDLSATRNFTLGRPVKAKPTPDGKSVLFLRAEPRSPVMSLYKFDVATAQAKTLATPQQILKGAEEKLSPEEKARRERMRVTAKGFTTFQLSDDGKLIVLSLSGKLYTLAGDAVSELPPAGVIDPQLSPDGKKIAYVRERDLYLLDLASKKEKRLTTSKDASVTNGLAEFVAQEEMSRFSGFWWSGDSKKIAYEEADSKGVERLHVPDVARPEAAPEPTAYPRPGKSNVKVRLGVISVEGGATTWVPWDSAKFPYLTYVNWKDRAPLTFVVMSREQRDLEVWAWDAGKARRLLVEHDDAWIDVDPTVPRWLPDGSAFLWSSDRDGVRQLELRGSDGKLERLLSAKDDHYDELLDVDDKRRQAWFAGSRDSSEMHLYRVSLDGGGRPGGTGSPSAQGSPAALKLTQEPGIHTVTVGKDHATWVDRFATESSLPRVVVHVDEKEIGELPGVAEAPPFMSKLELTRVGAENFVCALVRPRAFDAKKKYPVVLHVYGGPTSLVAKRQPELMRQWIADHGVIVAACDGRGTPGRGRAWERHIVGDFSRTLDDQVTALKALGAKYPELDLARVGVYGWSFGGWLAGLAVMKRPDVFKVGVAGAPVVDWHDYDTFYTERYLGLPDANKKGYEASSLLSYAKELQRPLLVIHGTSDDNVYFFHALKLADALFRAGRNFEILPLVGLTHMVPDPVVTENLYTKIASTLTGALR